MNLPVVRMFCRFLRTGPKQSKVPVRPKRESVPSVSDVSKSISITRNPEKYLSPARLKLDMLLPSKTGLFPSEDGISVALSSISSFDQLFDLTAQIDERRLEEVHLVPIMKLVYDLQKSFRTKYKPETLHDNSDFIRICQRLRKVAPTFHDINDLLNCMKTLSICRVPEDSLIYQTILHLIKEKVNDMSLEQIIHFNSLLEDSKDPLAKALKIALPIVFQTQLVTQLDKQNIDVMVDAMTYAAPRSLPEASIKLIADSITSYRGSISASQLFNLLWALSTMRDLKEKKCLPLLTLVKKRLSADIDEMDLPDLQAILVRMGTRHSATNRSYWYDEDICRAVARRVVSERWTSVATASVARTFTKFGFVDDDFLEYFAGALQKSLPPAPYDPYYLLAPFALTGSKALENYDSVVENILELCIKNKEVNEKRLRLMIDCAVLGIYPQSVLQDVFNDVNNMKLRLTTNLDWYQLDILQRSVRIECPRYQGPLPVAKLTQRARKMFNDSKFFAKSPVENALRTALGGPQYLLNRMYTKMGHFIDHVVVLRPGGYPVATNAKDNEETKEVQYIEDVDATEGNQMILMKVYSPSSYIANGDTLKGYNLLELRTLERLGYAVVAINSEKWTKLSEYERIPFLMLQIRSKEDDVS